MSHIIKSKTTFDKPDRFREWVMANAVRDGEVELLNEEGDVVDRAVIEDGSIRFTRPNNTEEGEQ